MYKGFAEVDTIPNTHKRLREEGYHVSVCMLRGLVRSGALKAASSGNKALLYYPNVIKVLQEGTEPPEAVKRQILRLMQQLRKQWGSVHRLRTLPYHEEGSIWQLLSEKKENVA